MRLRSQELGTRNLVGERVSQRRKEIGMKQKDLLTQLQIRGIELRRTEFDKTTTKKIKRYTIQQQEK